LKLPHAPKKFWQIADLLWHHMKHWG